MSADSDSKLRSDVRLRAYVHTHQGLRQYMEDFIRVVVDTTSTADKSPVYYFGVFDGHGGPEAARLAQNYLFADIAKRMGDWSDIDDDLRVTKAIKAAFNSTHEMMKEHVESWPKATCGLPSTAGTTASVVVVYRNKMYTAHVGDSTVVLGQSIKCSKNPKNCKSTPANQRLYTTWFPAVLTKFLDAFFSEVSDYFLQSYVDLLDEFLMLWGCPSHHLVNDGMNFNLLNLNYALDRRTHSDHKPDCPVERRRIEESGGKVMKKSGVHRVVWKRLRRNLSSNFSQLSQTCDNNASSAFCIESVPFLAVARSLGDLWSYNEEHEEYVVSPVPDVSVRELSADVDRCIVLASDGVWNVVSPADSIQAVQHCVQRYKREKDAKLYHPSQRLVQLGIDRWNNGCMRADNTSAIVVVLLYDDEDSTGLLEELCHPDLVTDYSSDQLTQRKITSRQEKDARLSPWVTFSAEGADVGDNNNEMKSDGEREGNGQHAESHSERISGNESHPGKMNGNDCHPGKMNGNESHPDQMNGNHIDDSHSDNKASSKRVSNGGTELHESANSQDCAAADRVKDVNASVKHECKNDIKVVKSASSPTIASDNYNMASNDSESSGSCNNKNNNNKNNNNNNKGNKDKSSDDKRERISEGGETEEMQCEDQVSFYIGSSDVKDEPLADVSDTIESMDACTTHISKPVPCASPDNPNQTLDQQCCSKLTAQTSCQQIITPGQPSTLGQQNTARMVESPETLDQQSSSRMVISSDEKSSTSLLGHAAELHSHNEQQQQSDSEEVTSNPEVYQADSETSNDRCDSHPSVKRKADDSSPESCTGHRSSINRQKKTSAATGLVDKSTNQLTRYHIQQIHVKQA